ncbi:branched-chain amino acid transport system II carrier protein [Avibacterium paragallinarum]|uniref:branched-chain amino acid transport system II carrier protein n=1 Tax=Avibacterium paragallinarum TaxID=728 RepID=UPI00021AD1F6|nr:branched-chain amino acid transport system II carrier protein [Avibacterium paragallinarum]AZI13210.1 branched-chain amino acid transport system II carrier protein [Avibacterium paragallinarum]QIR12725.1 branched-chain amino acid transport system II carrier protein [Avibacterium paragallinarum]QJE10391.1 branched-chain amino acid transport system II carrier protein [Avibacterium paragallinarum]QJE12583.1 branched-chain amino acid transport system II carrier protein [Avibacterium paragallinar
MLSGKDVMVLGMMIFSLFLGAGNIIFPPMEGYYAGTLWLWGALGFLLTGVFMPFITLIVVTLKGRGEALSGDLPKWAQVMFWTILYLVIGSTFAMPRVTNVAYEMAWQPLNLLSGEYSHIIFVTVFNLIGMGFMLGRSTMISSIGKFMAPALLVLLTIVAFKVINSPISPIVEPSNAYKDHSAIATGLIGGYQTMDVLSAMAFGGIVARALAVKGVSNSKAIVRYTLVAGTVSVVLLSLLYLCLFYLGATGEQVAKNSSNGGQLFAQYVNVLFGREGSWIMSGIVLLANLTTLVGVTSACADYFSKFHPRLTYTFFVVLFTISTIIISETGLNTLLRVTIPALLLIYPIAIMLVAMQLLREKLGISRRGYNLIIGITALFSVTDSLKNMELLPHFIQSLLEKVPLHQEGLTWLLPTLFVVMLCTLCKRKKLSS